MLCFGTFKCKLIFCWASGSKMLKCPDAPAPHILLSRFSGAQLTPLAQPMEFACRTWAWGLLSDLLSHFSPLLLCPHSLQQDFASHPSAFETPAAFLCLVPSPELILLKGVKQNIAQYFSNFLKRCVSPRRWGLSTDSSSVPPS